MLFSEGHALVIGVGADLPVTVGDAEGIHQFLIDDERWQIFNDKRAAVAAEQRRLDGIVLHPSRLTENDADKLEIGMEMELVIEPFDRDADGNERMTFAFQPAA